MPIVLQLGQRLSSKATAGTIQEHNAADGSVSRQYDFGVSARPTSGTIRGLVRIGPEPHPAVVAGVFTGGQPWQSLLLFSSVSTSTKIPSR
jgi:hypothetical protein